MSSSTTRPPARTRWPGVTLALLATAALAWVWLWFDHRGAGAGHHHGAGPVAAPFGLYVGAWLVMLVAMMLPTTRPLLGLFSTAVRSRRDRPVLLGAVVAGYLAAWLGAGVLAFLADRGARALAAVAPVTVAPGLPLVGVLALAGAYQFVPLKYRCLEQCRSPRTFVLTHWHGRRPLREAAWLGADHGRFCVGCCWALMAVMVVAGLHDLLVMAALAAVMAVEKNTTLGDRLARPIGVVLLLLAAVLGVDALVRV
ncbi:DUF2182 domain-containing protein [Pseudonocardia sp.]|uniref:DUF2182 domain-containing protein n=1 Tax=Pseudonocardia sp. TaxID=60912 RepID=UPI00261410D7|nr:DUF2182 domain-containing protein [Pseudonocardia sp.]